ncbi:hypothetical protein CTAYLR_004944 [Chrysophaeum taylorii]|uniref:EF-hand domain-containing protein n=1 Tax=Chrysophaeum taylorii TaxID=2483200 RepID=A0AAD7XSB2_9STRA|nr:hypothetical protein CTAYLR_004944 [Chrysophaeum taylorii]
MGIGTSSLKRELEAREAEVSALKARLEAIEAAQQQETDVMGDMVVPFTSQALLGSTLGYAAGYTLRAIGKVASLMIGSGFIMLQGLSYLGYVNVDWRKVERDYIKSFDKDADGAIGKDDLKQLWREFTDVLAFNLPAGTGFTGGLLYGLNFNPAMSAGLAASAGLGARFLLPRVALGGTAATGLPGLFVAAKKHYWAEDDFGFDGLRTLEDPKGDPSSS